MEIKSLFSVESLIACKLTQTKYLKKYKKRPVNVFASSSTNDGDASSLLTRVTNIIFFVFK